MVITKEGCPHRSKCYSPDSADPLAQVHAADKLVQERDRYQVLAGQLRMATTEILRMRGHEREAAALEAKLLRSNPQAIEWIKQMEQDIATALAVGRKITQARVLEEDDSHGL